MRSRLDVGRPGLGGRTGDFWAARRGAASPECSSPSSVLGEAGAPDPDTPTAVAHRARAGLRCPSSSLGCPCPHDALRRRGGGWRSGLGPGRRRCAWRLALGGLAHARRCAAPGPSTWGLDSLSHARQDPGGVPGLLARLAADMLENAAFADDVVRDRGPDARELRMARFTSPRRAGGPLRRGAPAGGFAGGAAEGGMRGGLLARASFLPRVCGPTSPRRVVPHGGRGLFVR